MTKSIEKEKLLAYQELIEWNKQEEKLPPPENDTQSEIALHFGVDWKA